MKQTKKRTDLRLHNRGGLGTEGVVEGDGVTKHTAGIPTAAVLLPFTHRQVWERERKETENMSKSGGNKRQNVSGDFVKTRKQKDTRRICQWEGTRPQDSAWWKGERERERKGEGQSTLLHKKRKKEMPQLEPHNVPKRASNWGSHRPNETQRFHLCPHLNYCSKNEKKIKAISLHLRIIISNIKIVVQWQKSGHEKTEWQRQQEGMMEGG